MNLLKKKDFNECPFSTRNSVIANLYVCVIIALLIKNKQTTLEMTYGDK